MHPRLDITTFNERAAYPDSAEARVDTIRRFVEKGISDLRVLLCRDVALARTELHSHLSEVRMTPSDGPQEWHYIAEGHWDLLGSGPNAPVLELAIRMVAGLS